MKHRLIVAGIQLALSTAGAQDASATRQAPVRGVVVNAEGHTITGALVTIEGTLLAARSADDGTFALLAPRGRWWLVARRVGFVSDSVVLDDGSTGQLIRLQLRPAPQSLRAITVEREYDALSGATIAPETMRNVPPLGEPDVFRTLVLLPAVAQPNDLIGALHLGGGAADETGIRLDGHPLQQPFHVLGALGAFNIASLDDATVRIHELPIDVDGHLGGIVDLRTRARRPDHNHEVDVSIASGSATALIERVPLGAQLLLSGRATYLNHLADAVKFNDEGGEPTSLLGYGDALTRLRFPALKIGELDMLAFRNEDRRDLAGGRGQRQPMKWGEWLGGVRWSSSRGPYLLGVRASHDVAFATYRPQNLRPREQSFDISQRLDELDVQLSQQSAAWTAQIGATLYRREHRLRWAYPAAPTNALLTTRTPSFFDRTSGLQTATAYGQATRSWGATRTTVGLRITGANGRTFVAPRFSARFAPSARLALSAAAERRLQFTSYLEEPKEGSILQPDYLLDRPRVADALSIGASWRSKTRPEEPTGLIRNLPGGIDVALFTRRFPDRTLLRDDPRTYFFERRSLPADFPQFARVHAHTSGATLGISQELPLRSVAQLAYTYERVIETYDGLSAPSSWDAPHSATIYLNTLLGKRWTLGAVGQFRSGAATTPVASRVFGPFRGVHDDVLANRYLLAPRNSGRLPGYQRIDLALRRTWTRAGGSLWLASFQIVNALGRDNVMSYDWNQYYCWRAGACRNPGAAQRGLPVIPTLGLEVHW